MRPYLAIILSLFVMASACSDDNNDNNTGVFKRDTGMKDDTSKTDMTIDPTDMGGMDTSDVGEDVTNKEDVGTDMKMDMEIEDVPPTCKTADCAAGEDCVNNACKIVDSCAAVKDLGALVVGTPIEEVGSFLDSGSDNIQGSCGMGVERVFSFTITAESRVDFEATWTGQFDGVVSFRSTCNDDGSEITCRDQESGFRVFQPGTYFVVLEVRVGNPDEFKLVLEAQELACTPGEGVCIGDELSYCTVNQPTLYACADTCTGISCDGDQCAAPVVIPAQGGAFSGDAFDYEDSYNFLNNANCPLDTDGYDVVYSLGSLVPGNFVNVKSSPFNAVFIMKGMNACGDTTGCVAMFDGVSDVDYVIPPLEGDDYHVIIDSKSAVQPATFNHEVAIPNR